MAAIRLEIAKEEIVQVTVDSASSGPVGFLCAGLDIEEKQCSPPSLGIVRANRKRQVFHRGFYG